MRDLSAPALGAKIVMASSYDSRFPPENIIDGRTDTFWTTTGLYPQSFVLELPEASEIKSITLQCYNVKKLSIEKTIKQDPVEFEEIFETVAESVDGTLQKITHSPESCQARYLRFIVKSGYDHFCAFYRLAVSGEVM